MGHFQLAGMFFFSSLLPLQDFFTFLEGEGGCCTIAIFILTRLERASNQVLFQFHKVFALLSKLYSGGT